MESIYIGAFHVVSPQMLSTGRLWPSPSTAVLVYGSGLLEFRKTLLS